MSNHVPYGIITVLAIMRERFREAGCPCPIHFGEEHAGDHDAPPRIVVMPSKKVPDRFKGPMPVQAKGLTPQTIAAIQAAGGQNPQSVRVLVTAWEAHIWARAPEQGDPEKQRVQDQLYLAALVNQFCLHLYRAAPGNDQMQGGYQPVPSKSMNHGQLYIVQFSVEVPIVDVDFSPGTIDERALTWPLVSGVHAEVTGETLDPADPEEETVINSVVFESPPQT